MFLWVSAQAFKASQLTQAGGTSTPYFLQVSFDVASGGLRRGVLDLYSTGFGDRSDDLMQVQCHLRRWFLFVTPEEAPVEPKLT